jgi:hypothetical protein
MPMNHPIPFPKIRRVHLPSSPSKPEVVISPSMTVVNSQILTFRAVCSLAEWFRGRPFRVPMRGTERCVILQ